MMKKVVLMILFFVIIFASCSVKSSQITSPDENIAVNFQLSPKDGAFSYVVKFKEKTIIDTSYIGFNFKNMPSLNKGFKAVVKKPVEVNNTWQMPWGEQLNVVNNYNEVTVQLEEITDLKRKVNVIFRVYNDGVGFRYDFPEQENVKEVFITDEKTEFNLTEDYKTFWIPGDWDIYEHLYSTTKLSEIDALNYKVNEALAQTSIPENAVNTPVTLV